MFCLDPIEALVWLANARRGGGLRAGEVAITGSCTGVGKAEAGDGAWADFSGLGAVDLVFTS